MLRHFNVFDIHRLVQRLEDRRRKRVPCLGATAADVVDAVATVFKEEHHHFHRVFHIDEIAFLFAVGIFAPV